MINRARAAAVALMVLMLAGCGQPQIANTREGVDLAMQLQTALSARQADLLPACRARLDTLLQQGKLSAAGAEALRAALAQAESGKWEQALAQHLALMKGQRPGG